MADATDEVVRAEGPSTPTPMTATVVYVAYLTEAIDLSWIPAHADVCVVVNGGARPHVGGRTVSWIEPGSNIGFGAAVNLAAAAAAHDRVVVVNPDCALLPAHFSALVKAEPGEVVTLPLSSAKVRTTVLSSYPGPLALVAGALRLRSKLRTHSTYFRPGGGLGPGESAPLRHCWVSGACFSVDRRRFIDVGGFSDAYFLYYEDVDLSQRLADAHSDMVGRVADVDAAQHAVGGSAEASNGRAAVERARSAATYASRQQGPGWALARTITTRHAASMSRRQRAAPGDSEPVALVIVNLGREQSRGERRRVRSWQDIAEAAGITSTEIRLLRDCRRPGAPELIRKVLAIKRREAVPESLAWSSNCLLERLRGLQPGTVIVLTSRAYDPLLTELVGTRVILDHVDRLSDSYRDRATAAGSHTPGGLAWRTLAVLQRRFEGATHPVGLRVAAGRSDAVGLGAIYAPMVATPAPEQAAATSRAFDVTFVGNLRYPPNLAAVQELDRLWPGLIAMRPGTTLLVAGANPPEEVHHAANRHGWTLIADFAHEAEIYASSRVAVAPLPFASGIQTKVIDALRHGLPVVGYPGAAAGFDESVPMIVASTPTQLSHEVIRLLDDDTLRTECGRAGRRWIGTHLNPVTWSWLLDPVPATNRG